MNTSNQKFEIAINIIHGDGFNLSEEGLSHLRELASLSGMNNEEIDNLVTKNQLRKLIEPILC